MSARAKSPAMDSPNERQIKKTKHQNDEDEDPINYFAQLPYEIVINILSRLPVTSLIQSTFVCRFLSSLYHDPNLIKTHLSRSCMNKSSCVIIHSDLPIRNELHFLQIPDDKVRKIEIPFDKSMSEFSIIGSSNGLLCLVNALFSESIYLYNPFTRNYLVLPKNIDPQDMIVVYGFGSHPVTNDLNVIKIACYTVSLDGQMDRDLSGFKPHLSMQESEVKIYSLSSNTWKSIGLVPHRLEKWSSPGVLVSGRLHWVSQWVRRKGPLERTIVSYSLADDSFRAMKCPVSSSSDFGRWAICHLASLDGCLCAVVPVPPGHGAFHIWVMKEYGVNESWVKEYNIGVYYPVSIISHEMERYNIWRNMFGKKTVRVLCVLDIGEVLLEFRGGGLVLYDVHKETFKELAYSGMSRIYQATVHVGSLVSAAFPL